MKGVNKTVKIIVIVLNAIFLAGLLFGMSRYGVRPRGLLDKAGLIFILVFPAVTLVTIALTFRKEGKKPASILRIIAVIVNILFLIIFITAIALEGVSLEHFGQLLVCIMGLGLPVLNVVAVALAKN
jgi:hypothetical protein